MIKKRKLENASTKGNNPTHTIGMIQLSEIKPEKSSDTEILNAIAY